MTRLWNAIAIGALGLAAYRWLHLFEWLTSGLALEQAINARPMLLVVGPTAVRNYFVGITCAAALAALAAQRLRGLSPPFRRCAQAAMYALVAVGVLWVALVASPFVELASPFAG